MPVQIPPSETELSNHPVVSDEEWLTARRELLLAEKEATRKLDDLAARRRQLPWRRISKPYVFDTPGGPATLAELFAGRSQLIAYHFMLGPGWEEGCSGCSFLSDHFDGANLHLRHHDVTLLAISRAPLDEIMKFKARMGWQFPWVSSHGGDFNYDFHATTRGDGAPDAGDEHHGISVFFRNSAGEVFHTYSAFARGVDLLCGAHNLLDLTPRGRNEHSLMDWVRLHDRYDGSAPAGCCCDAA